MAEEKKKKNTTKSTTTKKVNNTKKTTTSKKTNNKNKKQVKKTTQATKQQPKKQVKKVAPKKQPTKKVAPKKVEEPKVEKVELEVTEEIEQPIVTKEIEKVIEVETETNEEESLLEKTLIFDGRENQNLAEVVQKLEEENVVLEDKIIKRSKGKKIAVMILTALIFVVIIATTFYIIHCEVTRIRSSQTLNSNIYDKVSNHYGNINDIDTEKKTDSELTNEEYKNIEDLTLGQFEKKILENEDMIVLVSSTTCFYCIEYEPIVNDVFKELDEKIYRINIISLTDAEDARFRSYYAYKKAPTIFTIKKGVVKNELVGKKEKKELLDWINHNK